MPSLGIIFVIDRSGSMGGGELELAKEAVLRSIELLRDTDTVGVIAFDDTPWWVVEPVALSDRGAVEEAVLGIQAGGGTHIHPAVSAALDGMMTIDAQRRHIILLTDGQSAGGGNAFALTDAMVEAGITMSTVAVGYSADTALLKRLAEEANGRFYHATDNSTIPAIFSRETVMTARTYVVEKRFVPAVGQAGDWLSLFAPGVPAVDAYVATTAKETAETVLVTPEGDPLLARWSYGAGRTVAWTSDLAGKWAADWMLWPEFPDMLAAWVKWTFPQFSADAWHVRASLEGGAAAIEMTAQGDVGSGNLTVSISGEDGDTVRLKPVPAAPGEYTLKLDDARPGAYFMRISEGSREDGPASEGALAGFVVPYPPEYRISGEEEGAELLAEIARLTGGRTLPGDQPGEVFRAGKIAAGERIDPTRVFLIAALLIWLADIAVRRLSLPWGAFAAALTGRLAGRRREGGMAADAAAAWERLGQRTRNFRDLYAGGEARRAERTAHASGAGAARNPEPEGGSPEPNHPAGLRGSAHKSGSAAASRNDARLDDASPAAVSGDAGMKAGRPGDSGSADAGRTGQAEAGLSGGGSPLDRLLAAKRRADRR